MATYNKRQMQKILHDNGYYLDHYSGGHAIYKKSGAEKTISLAFSKCNKMIFKRLIKEYRLTV